MTKENTDRKEGKVRIASREAPLRITETREAPAKLDLSNKSKSTKSSPKED